MGEALTVGAILGVLLGIGFGIYVLVAANRTKKSNITNKEQVMDDLFDGSPQVIYKDALQSGLPLDTLIAGAGARGYRLSQTVQDSGYMKSHIFERVSPEPRP